MKSTEFKFFLFLDSHAKKARWEKMSENVKAEIFNIFQNDEESFHVEQAYRIAKQRVNHGISSN